MKKLAILLLVFAILGLTGCNIVDSALKPTASDVCEIARQSRPTKITTEVSYITNSGDTLSGYYVTSTDGTNVIFEYHYERLATPAESVELGTNDRIIVSEGVINYKDGVYTSGDAESWKPGTGTAFDLKFNVDERILRKGTLNEDGTYLETKLSNAELIAILGTDLGATDGGTLTLITNRVNLNTVVVSCNVGNGTVTVRNTYTYNTQNLFPEVTGE